MGRIMLTPGSTGVAKHAIDLFGIERVEVGSWMYPVYVNDLSEEEIEFAEKFFCEYNIRVTRESP